MVTLRALFRFTLVLVLGMGIGLAAGCSSDDDDDGPPVTPPPPPSSTGTIIGTAALPAGFQGDLSNARVALYDSYEHWNGDVVMMQATGSGSASQISFSFAGLNPGSYYLDVWKDYAQPTGWSAGDLYGVYGTYVHPNWTPLPIQVTAGGTASVSLLCYEL